LRARSKWNFVLANSFCTVQSLVSALVCHKYWSAEESRKSSTWRELVAINFALEAFVNHIAGRAVACNTDNQNVVRIIHAGSW